MKNIFKKYLNIQKKNQKGYTLLEYCAGAAVIAGIVFAALNTLGGGFNAYLTGLAGWVQQRTSDFTTTTNGSNPTP